MVSALDTNLDAGGPPEPINDLLARLAEPRTVESLNRLLDHLDLLALLVVGLDGLLSRGDTIADSIGEAVRELRPAGSSVDVGQLLDIGQQCVAAAPAVLTMLPVLESVAASELSDPRLIDLASTVSRAAVRGAAEASREPAPKAGLRTLWRAYRDEDVARALAFVVTIAKALGQELAAGPNAGNTQSSHA
ncbi:DUF1641 domain-containing protein [Dactylosporangium sp. NPDC005572]|uniref:DUF1641 domain-containing protein n=1 Tax=Dactylosporangium sp. NPDC005572 TaxID=3156889 RepID=UPI0033BAFC0E